MSAARIANQMRLQSLMVQGSNLTVRIGIITSYDPDAYAAKATIQPDEIETGWLPIQALQAGNGWGVYAPPSEGDQVVLVFVQGDAESGVILGALPSDEDRPPPVPQGEVWVVSEGAEQFLKLTADGIKSKGSWAHEGEFAVTGPVTIDGDTTSTGDLTADGTLTGTTDVVGGGKHLKTHTHGGVQSGGSQTLAPT